MRFLDLDNAVNLGGHRLSVDDLQYLQDGIFDVVDAMARVIGSGSTAAILSDMAITDNGTTFNVEKPAAVYYQGKVWLVPSASNQVKGAGGEYKFQLVTELGANDPVTYGSGAQFNVHKNQYMRVVYTNLTGSDYVAFTAFTGSDWNAYTPATISDITYAGPGESLSCRYRVQGKTMFLSINFTGQFTNVSVPTISLPFNHKFKANGAKLLAGTTPAGADGAEGIVRAAWNANTNEIRFGNSTGSGLLVGAVDIRDTLIFEIA